MICMIILFLFLTINYKKDENIYIEDEFKKVRNDGKITLYEKYENFDKTSIDTNFNSSIHRSIFSRNIISNSTDHVSVYIFPNHNTKMLKTRYNIIDDKYECSQFNFFDGNIIKQIPLVFVEISLTKDNLLHVPRGTFVAIENPKKVHVFKKKLI